MCRYPSSRKAANAFDIQKKNKQQTIPIIQPTSLLLENSGICQPPPARETENWKKMKNKTLKDKTMCGQAPADQPTDDKCLFKKLNEQIKKKRWMN